MNTNIEAQHYKYNKKFECLDEIAINLLKMDEIKCKGDIEKRLLEVNKLKIRYQELISPVLHEYYKIQLEEMKLEDGKKLQEQYQNATMSENIVSEMDFQFEQLCKYFSVEVQTRRRKKADKKNSVNPTEVVSQNRKILSSVIQKPSFSEQSPFSEQAPFSEQISEQKDDDIIEKMLKVYNQKITAQTDMLLERDQPINEQAYSALWEDEISEKVRIDGANATPLQKLEYYKNIYENTKILYSTDKKDTNICENCGKKMAVFPGESELRCEECGNIKILQGIVFEDSQFYNQQVSGRAKKYDENMHCEKWLYRILAREKDDIPQRIILQLKDKMKTEYKRDSVKSVQKLRCEKIRSWLKECKITEYNKHAPLLRKILTSEFGNSVIPPQLSIAEIQTVLNEYSEAMKIFNNIIKDISVLRILDRKKIKNRLYYPYILWKILEIKFEGDHRLNGLLECIHLPSSDTLKRNDIVWKIISRKMGYDYYPTDRSVLATM